MKTGKRWCRDTAITCGVLVLCLIAGVLLQDVFGIPEQVTTAFAFAVFLISLLTDGYMYGLTAAFVSVLLVNYAFTFPYFSFNFVIRSNFFSAVVMAVISVLTSALTTKVKRQEAMKAETELERMRANLLRAISHDLRTPLTTIYGSCTAIRENGGRLTEQQKDKMLLGIQEDAQWLVSMVENLLSVTRIDSGKLQLSTVPTAVDELIDTALVKFRNRYPERKVIVQLPEELVLVDIDAMLIQQVLINLLENAVQHGGEVTHLQLQVSVQGKWAHFEVRDNGRGIPTDRLSAIFTGLYEAKERPADHARRNAGIGLSVCATIIRAHGGTITAGNLPEGGARFCFTLKTEETITDE